MSRLGIAARCGSQDDSLRFATASEFDNGASADHSERGLHPT